MILNKKDQVILELLQRDATLPISEIAAEVGLSTTPCWRRIHKLEQAGFIKGRVALLNRQKLNLGVTVFAAVKASRHHHQWLDRFRSLISEIPEIIEAHRMSGDTDYLLHIVVPSIQEYDQVYQRLIENLEFADISSAFSMETMKTTTSLPTKYLGLK
ncbi:MAG: Lrp/AsnC family transcriptional regulator [Gammaproteobacteria bacterium]|nr:Lrp/AsnC family transcriptional regulator [Gammaproteobacteria bacterium]